MSTVINLYRYPIKGMSPEILQTVSLQTGEAIALDRGFALAHGTTTFNPDVPEHFSKTHFLMLMKNERLAALHTVYNDNSGILEIFQQDKLLVSGALHESAGRAVLEKFFINYLGDEIRGIPKLLEAPSGYMFSDVDAKVLSCINLATVRELEKLLGVTINPLRFRANVYFDGVPAWAESEWVGKTLTLGTAKVQGVKLIERCAATNVNPESAMRDLKIPQTLIKTYGHRNFGIYVRVIEDGDVAVNDEFTVNLASKFKNEKI
jgi:uncharacterized protein YcbX